MITGGQTPVPSDDPTTGINDDPTLWTKPPGGSACTNCGPIVSPPDFDPPPEEEEFEDVSVSSPTEELFTDVFDPPSALKTVNAEGLPVVEWKMVWINAGNTTALDVFLVDPVPNGTTYVDGSFTCEARGDSITTSCLFNPVLNRVEWLGNIAPDLNGTDEDDSLHEVVLIYETSVPDSVNELVNQAEAFWDEDGDDDVFDDIESGQVAALSDDPRTSQEEDPTRWSRYGLANTGHPILLPLGASTFLLILILYWNRDIFKRNI